MYEANIALLAKIANFLGYVAHEAGFVVIKIFFFMGSGTMEILALIFFAIFCCCGGLDALHARAKRKNLTWHFLGLLALPFWLCAV